MKIQNPFQESEETQKPQELLIALIMRLPAGGPTWLMIILPENIINKSIDSSL